MSVSDEAVNAAAALIRTVDYPNYDPDPVFARKVLEAAAPHMVAEVWDQAIEAHKAWTWDDENMDPLTNPYRPTP